MVNATKVQDMLEPVVQSLDCELWGLEFLPQGKQKLLRVYIDKQEGVNVDDCARVSRQLAALLDVEDVIAGEYVLEVSSPGAARPLFKIEQYKQYIGSELKVKLLTAFDGRKNYRGVLDGVVDDEIVIIVDTEEYTLPVELVDKAHIVPHF